jgi:transcriptional regulator with XRE-family HTH domain
MALAKTFPKQLRRAREAAGLTPEQLAAAAGLNPRTVLRVEAGTHVPKLDTADALLGPLNAMLVVAIRSSEDG